MNEELLKHIVKDPDHAVTFFRLPVWDKDELNKRLLDAPQSTPAKRSKYKTWLKWMRNRNKAIIVEKSHA